MQIAAQSAGGGTKQHPHVSASGRSWSSWHRVLFRFTSTYLVLYLTYAVVAYAGVKVPVLGSAVIALWEGLTDRVGIQVLRFSEQDMVRQPKDSGDILAGFVFVFCALSMALVVTVAWSILDRKRQQYDELHGWVRLIVRCALFYILFAYGIDKVFPLQFSPPQPSTLLRRYGEFTTFDVLWQFMGASLPYTIFCGIVEVLGALLLVWRRTTTLGALICSAALLNVVVLNFSYDIGVKLYSLHLLLMAVFLLAPDVKPLTQVLVLRQPANPSWLPDPRFENGWGARAVWTVFVGVVLYTHISTAWWYFERRYISPRQLPMHGVYDVETFIRNGQDVPLAAKDRSRWEKVFIENPGTSSHAGSLHVRQLDDQPGRTVQFRFSLQHNPAKHELVLTRSGDRDPRTLAYRMPDADHLELSGTIQQGTVYMRLRKLDISQLRLTKQRFHLVQPNALGKPDWASAP